MTDLQKIIDYCLKPISKIGFGTLSLWRRISNKIIAKHVPKIWVHRKCVIATSGGAANVLVRVSHSSSTAGTGVHCFANVSGIALTHSERMMCQSNCHLVYCLIFQDLMFVWYPMSVSHVNPKVLLYGDTILSSLVIYRIINHHLYLSKIDFCQAISNVSIWPIKRLLFGQPRLKINCRCIVFFFAKWKLFRFNFYKRNKLPVIQI